MNINNDMSDEAIKLLNELSDIIEKLIKLSDDPSILANLRGMGIDVLAFTSNFIDTKYKLIHKINEETNE